MTKKTELQKDREDVANRLRKSDKETWESLSEEKREKAVDTFFELIDPNKLDSLELINDSWARAYAVDTTVVGVMLGLLGGIAGAIADRHLMTLGLVYDFFGLVLFAGLLVFFIHLPKMMKIRTYKDGRLLKKLLDSAN